MAGAGDRPLKAKVRRRLTRAMLSLGPTKSGPELANLDERTLLRAAIGWPLKRSSHFTIEAALDRYEASAAEGRPDG